MYLHRCMHTWYMHTYIHLCIYTTKSAKFHAKNIDSLNVCTRKTDLLSVYLLHIFYIFMHQMFIVLAISKLF